MGVGVFLTFLKVRRVQVFSVVTYREMKTLDQSDGGQNPRPLLPCDFVCIFPRPQPPADVRRSPVLPNAACLSPQSAPARRLLASAPQHDRIMPPGTIYLCRHATRADLVDQDWHKTSATPYDPPLALNGARECARLGEQIASYITVLGNPHRVFIHSSPFLRCIQTALALSESLTHLPTLRLDAWLGEWLTPDYFDHIQPPPPMPTMVRDAEESLLERAHTVTSAKLDLAYNALQHGEGSEYGEEWSHMHKRIRESFELCLQSFTPEDTLILVTHGAACNAILGALTQRPVLIDVGLGSLSHAVWDITRGQYEVRAMAVLDHLRTPSTGGGSPWQTPPLSPVSKVNVRRAVSTREPTQVGLWERSETASPEEDRSIWMQRKSPRRATLNS